MKINLTSICFTFILIIYGQNIGVAQDVWVFGDENDCIESNLLVPTCTESTSNVVFQYEGINETTLNIYTDVPPSNYTWTIIPGANDEFEFIVPNTAAEYEFTLYEDFNDSGGIPDEFDCVLGILTFNAVSVQITNEPYTPAPICSGESTEQFIVTTEPSEDVTISWTAMAVGVDGLINTSGESEIIPIETLTTTGDVPGTVLYSIVATLGEEECTDIFEYTVTVNPIPVITNTDEDITICDGEDFDGLVLMTNVTGTEIMWTATYTNISGETSTSGVGDLPAYIELMLVDTTTSGKVLYTVTLSNSNNNCIPADYTYEYVVDVDPIPVITNTDEDITICDGENFDGLILMTNVTGTEILWTATFTNISGETSTSGVGNLPAYTELMLEDNTVSGTVLYTVTLSDSNNNCIPADYTYEYVVTVNPIPVITNTDEEVTICDGEDFDGLVLMTNVSSGTEITWMATFNNIFGETTDSGIGNLPSYIELTLDNSLVQGNVEFRVTLSNDTNGCVPDNYVYEFTVYVDPKPTFEIVGSPICQDDLLFYSLEFESNTLDITSSNDDIEINTSNKIISNIPSGNDEFTITAILNGCEKTVTIEMFTCTCITIDAPLINVSGEDEVCEGDDNPIFEVEELENHSVTWYTIIGQDTAIVGNELEFTPSNSNPGMYTYYASYTNNENMCESSFGSQLFTILATPSISFTPEMNELCSGNMVDIDLSSMPDGADFTWTASQNGVTNAEPGEGININQTLNGDGTVTYSVTATLDENGCSSNQDIEVVVNGLPDVSINSTSSTEVCEGTIIQLLGESMDEDEIETWSWSGPNETESMDFTIPNANSSDDGVYTLLVSDINGCTSTVNIGVEVKDQIVVMETIEDVLCKGGNSGSINLELFDGFETFDIMWETGEITKDINELEAGIYSVTVTSGNGGNKCEVEKTYEVKEPEQLIFQNIEVYSESCEEADDGKVVITISGGTPSYSFQQENIDIPNGTMEGLTDGDFTYEITDENGCTIDTIITIDEGTKIEPDFEISGDTNFCEEGFVEITDISTSTSSNGMSNIWTINDQNFSDLEKITFGNDSDNIFPGNYVIALLIQSMSNPDANDPSLVCEESIELPDVNIYDTPEIIGITFTDLDISDGDCRGNTFSLESDILWFDNNATGSSIDEYDWNASYSQFSNIPNPVFNSSNIANSGDLEVNLQVTSIDGCISSIKEESQLINENPLAVISGTLETTFDIQLESNYSLESGSSEALNGAQIESYLWGFNPNVDIAIDIPNEVYDENKSESFDQNIIVRPREIGAHNFDLEVTDNKNCKHKSTIERVVNNCKATFETFSLDSKICQGSELIFNIQYSPSPSDNQPFTLGEYDVYLENGTDSINLQSGEGSVGNLEIQQIVDQIGVWSIIIEFTELPLFNLGCEDAKKQIGTIEVIDNVNLENIEISISKDIICRDLQDQEKISISGVEGIDSEDLQLNYTVIYEDNNSIVIQELLSIPLVSNGIEINLPTLVNPKINSDIIVIFNDITQGEDNTCMNIIDTEIKYQLLACDNATNLNCAIDPQEPTVSSSVACEDEVVIVEIKSTYQECPTVEEEQLIFYSVLSDNVITLVGEEDNILIELIQDQVNYILIPDNLVSKELIEISTSLDFEVNRPYYVYTFGSIEGDNELVQPIGAETITFRSSPRQGILDLEATEYCRNQILEISMQDQEPGLDESSYQEFFSLYDSFGNEIEIAEESFDNERYFYQLSDLPSGNYLISGTAIFNHEETECSTESELSSFLINEESSPESENIRWWPNNILTSEDTESIENKCFQWGAIDKDSGEDISGSQLDGKEIDKPFLFTDDDQFTEFKNSPSNPNTDFPRIYYLDTWFNEGESCSERPETCYTRVFFTEDQFKFRDEDYENLDLFIKPNPTTGSFFISLPDEFIEGRVIITNRFGQRVCNDFLLNGEPEVKLELDYIPSDVYFIKVLNQEGKSLNNKLVIINH